jgi:hypothetical protein
MPEYLIKTRQDQLGPFTPEQIRVFVEKGKLPLTFRLLDLDSGRGVLVQDVLAAFEAPEVSGEDGTLDQAPEEAPAPPQGRAAPTRPRPGLRRRAAASRGRFAASRPPRAMGPEGEPSQERGRGPRVLRRRPDRTAIILSSCLGALIAGGLIVAIIRWLPSSESIVGAWSVDTNALLNEAVEKGKVAAAPDAAALAIGQSLLASMFKGFEFHFDQSTFKVRVNGADAAAGQYTLRDLGGGRQELAMAAAGGPPESFPIEIDGGTMKWFKKEATLVLRRN